MSLLVIMFNIHYTIESISNIMLWDADAAHK